MNAQPDHTVSNRGFVHTAPIKGTDNATVRVYESSGVASFWPEVGPDGSITQGEAEGPFIWLAVHDGGTPPTEVHAHLPLEAARRVRDSLSFLIARSEED